MRGIRGLLIVTDLVPFLGRCRLGKPVTHEDLDTSCVSLISRLERVLKQIKIVLNIKLYCRLIKPSTRDILSTCHMLHMLRKCVTKM